MNARVKSLAIRKLNTGVRTGQIHPDIAPIAADFVQGLPRMRPAETLTEVKKIVKGARKASKQAFRAQEKAAAAAFKKADPRKFWGGGIEVIEEVAEVASQL